MSEISGDTRCRRDVIVARKASRSFCGSHRRQERWVIVVRDDVAHSACAVLEGLVSGRLREACESMEGKQARSAR